MGDKGIGRKVILDDAELAVPTQDLGAPTGSIREVEEAVAVDENDVGTNSEDPRVEGEAEDVEMVDDDAPDADAGMEVDAPPKQNRTAGPSPAPKKRRRSGNAKPNAAEENDSTTPSRTVPTGHRTHSEVEVDIPPRPGYASPWKDNTPAPARANKSASRKLVSESPVSVKKSGPAKVKTPARKSVPVVEEEEEEPVLTKRGPPKKTQKRRRDESESEEEHELSDKPTQGPSNPKPMQITRATQRPPQGSSPPPIHLDDAPRGRRSAAQKADEKLKDIMPDVINFQKEMKRGAVVGGWEKAEKEQERADKKTKEKEKSKENPARDKVKGTAKKRRSDLRYDFGSISIQIGAHHVNYSVKGEEEEGDQEPRSSKPAGDDVYIMTTKVQVSEDTKKVRSILVSAPYRRSTLLSGIGETRC